MNSTNFLHSIVVVPSVHKSRKIKSWLLIREDVMHLNTPFLYNKNGVSDLIKASEITLIHQLMEVNGFESAGG